MRRKRKMPIVTIDISGLEEQRKQGAEIVATYMNTHETNQLVISGAFDRYTQDRGELT
jgi:hypothetical protein